MGAEENATGTTAAQEEAARSPEAPAAPGERGGPVAFYFDFSSPYGYIASEVIDPLCAAHGRSVVWRPFLLGAVYKVTGAQPLTDVPLKNNYTRHDFERSARLLKLPLVLPQIFPFSGVAACRAFYWVQAHDTEKAVAAARLLFRAAFQDGRPIDSADAVADVLGGHPDIGGVSHETVLAALAEHWVKERTRQEVDAAIARGVFGSPFMIVDGEEFWGSDRLGQLQHWLATGGW